MSRNTPALKELIYSTLTADSQLETLLGGPGKIRHGNPLQVSEYPMVVYSIIAEEDEEYDPTLAANVTRTRVAIQTFSNDTQSEQSDEIDDRIYEILHGKNLSSSEILVYTTYRVTRIPIYEADIEVWRVESRYDFVNVVK